MKTVVILLTVLAGWFTAGKNTPAEGYQVGDVVADFSLTNVDGNKVSLADYKDAKGYIVVFTCNTCPVSVAYEDRINALDKKYKPLGYPVIAINPNDPGTAPAESLDHMKKRAQEKGFTFPYLEDPDHIITKRYAASRTPHTFILQKTSQGNVLRYIGAIDDNTNEDAASSFFVQNAIAALESGAKPDPDFTKAVGCTIKWKKGS